jgi:hypothetical protein
MGAAAAIILLKERQVVEAFERAGATSPEHAMDPAHIGVEQDGIGWRRLRDHAVVRETSPGSGRYYLDVEVWHALRRMRRRMLAVLLAIMIVLALVFFGVVAGRR